MIGFSGGLTRDNTLLSELQATGVVLQFAQRNQWSFNPTWTRMLSEKLSFQSGVQFSDTTYESGRLVDYRLFGGSGGFSYALTERDQVQIMGSYLDFRTTDSPSAFRSNFPGIDMSLTHAFSESLDGHGAWWPTVSPIHLGNLRSGSYDARYGLVSWGESATKI